MIRLVLRRIFQFALTYSDYYGAPFNAGAVGLTFSGVF